MPAVLLGAAAQARIIASHDNLEKEALEKSAKVAIEGITNIRTVAGLGREADFVRRYVKTIEETHVQAQKKAHIRGTNFCTGSLCASCILLTLSMYQVPRNFRSKFHN